MLEKLKEDVCKANLDLVVHGLVIMTWGNVSAIDREKDLIVIKPSGLDYKNMTAEDMVVVTLDGEVVEGNYKPSSDLPTHLELYRNWETIISVVHTHSSKACSFAQAMRPIPCYGTTHADHFYGQIPLTPILSSGDVNTKYEQATGEIIVKTFDGIDPLAMPAVLVGNHGPFTWGQSPSEAVKNSVALEAVAAMAIDSLALNPAIEQINDYILDKHYFRKHGPNAYYGQSN